MATSKKDLTAYPFDPAAAGPCTSALFGHSGKRTYRPVLMRPDDAGRKIDFGGERDPFVRRFLKRQIAQSNRIRELIQREHEVLRRILGGENIMLSYSLREGFSTDSTGSRGLAPEAVFSPPSEEALRGILSWCFRNRVPVVPYGAGGGYNMGVMPKVPAVTVWPTVLGHIGDIQPHPHPQGMARYIIEAGAGVPFARLAERVSNQGFALRCIPNTPRASVGGVVATGSNGGKRIAEIVVDGEAVLADGRLVRFATTPLEQQQLETNPFPLIHKFQGAPESIETLRGMLRRGEILPASLFVGSEGTTGIITKVRLAVERRLSRGLCCALWFESLEDVSPFAGKVNALPPEQRPVHFELLTEPAISRYLATDYPDLFGRGEQAYVTLTFEGDDSDWLLRIRRIVSSFVHSGVRMVWVGPFQSETPPEHAARLTAPREALPGKLRTKCKSDVEVLLDYLPRAIHLLAEPRTTAGDLIESILFGHLSLSRSAIIHWNIGGIDLAVEDSASRAWDHLERTLTELTAPDPDGIRHACFTGEHGAAGKPSLFREALTRGELARMYRIKRVLDPRRLMNPATLFLPTRISRAIHGRALSSRRSVSAVAERIAELTTSCTRCNACQNCLVLESQAALRTERTPRNNGGWIMGKRHLLQLLELVHSAEIDRTIRTELLDECETALKMCISCGRCDVACPAEIPLVELRELLIEWKGSNRSTSPALTLFYRLLLAPSSRSLPLLLSAPAMKLGNRLSHLLHKKGFSAESSASYLAFPTLGWRRYKPKSRDCETELPADIDMIGDIAQRPTPRQIYIRFRGCVGTIGRTEGTVHEDRFIADVCGQPFLDFRPDLCCGYPHQSIGAFAAARERRMELCKSLIHSVNAAKQILGAESASVFSSCPTCQESLRIGLAELASSVSPFAVVDPAEILIDALTEEMKAEEPHRGRIGLKVPCHATNAATEAQLRLFQCFGFDAVRLDQCCGMAGTGRLKHPDIGLVLARELSETVRRLQLHHVVSGCPSCRDGVSVQSTIEGSKVVTADVYGFLLGALQDSQDH